jgi:plastocyanin
MKRRTISTWLLSALTVTPGPLRTQDRPVSELRLRVVSSLPASRGAVPAVVWLKALPGTLAPPFVPHGHYTLLQKNRMFTPHLQVIPVGSVVDFPNADPFFHNVFSEFDGKRFDLGLYEAGTSKSVTFPREGASYIFCNIHPEMSAVILTLSTPLYAIADGNDSFSVSNIPPGNYRLHLWIEGVPQTTLDGLSRTVHVGSHDLDLGAISAPVPGRGTVSHTNKFGNPYETDPRSPY